MLKKLFDPLIAWYHGHVEDGRLLADRACSWPSKVRFCRCRAKW